MNPFEFLGVEPNTTEQEIKSAYRHKLKQLHPDKHPGAPENILAQLAEFTRQLNYVYKDLIPNLDHYRRQYTPSTPKVASKPNAFGFPASTLTRLERANLSTANLNQLLNGLSFPHITSNLALTAIRMRSLAIKNSSSVEDRSFQFAMMFILGAKIARLIFGENLGESGDVLDLKNGQSQGYIQGALEDSEYFMDVSDSDIRSFLTILPSNIRTWVSSETKRLSNGVISTEIVLQRFIVSGMVFILFQV